MDKCPISTINSYMRIISLVLLIILLVMVAIYYHKISLHNKEYELL
jgi:hypothetical protein